MRTPVMIGAAVAAGLAAAACQGAKKTNDAAAVGDTAAAASSAMSDSTVAPPPGSAPPAAATSGAPNGAAKPATAASPTSMGKATTGQGATAPRAPTVKARIDTTPRPANQPPAGATTPAFIVFRDSLGTADVAWLKAQGFTIMSTNETAHSASVGVPDGYHGNPKANPRVLRFTIAMR